MASKREVSDPKHTLSSPTLPNHPRPPLQRCPRWVLTKFSFSSVWFSALVTPKSWKRLEIAQNFSYFRWINDNGRTCQRLVAPTLRPFVRLMELKSFFVTRVRIFLLLSWRISSFLCSTLYKSTYQLSELVTNFWKIIFQLYFPTETAWALSSDTWTRCTQ